ncbi:vegetative cell wall protein gp1-like [Neopelma chrysocephalum]|uniref:vegetative cell wall protein gp1-like n=1 Tax=Neopelma chrysocephalum TaxID=114329 RepID=UPI000FCD2703|nr:vegetative cell wall protein gp1-like [Neopelma chrysocephalum]
MAEKHLRTHPPTDGASSPILQVQELALPDTLSIGESSDPRASNPVTPSPGTSNPRTRHPDPPPFPGTTSPALPSRSPQQTRPGRVQANGAAEGRPGHTAYPPPALLAGSHCCRAVPPLPIPLPFPFPFPFPSPAPPHLRGRRLPQPPHAARAAAPFPPRLGPTPPRACAAPAPPRAAQRNGKGREGEGEGKERRRKWPVAGMELGGGRSR